MQADVCEAPGKSQLLRKRWLGGLGAGGAPWSVEENRYDQACSTNLLHSRPRSGHWGLRLKQSQTKLCSLPSLKVLTRPILQRLDSVSTFNTKSVWGVLGDEMCGGAAGGESLGRPLLRRRS